MRTTAIVLPLLAVAGILSGCAGFQSSSIDHKTLNRQMQVAGEAVAFDASALDGRWHTVFHCTGLDYVLDTGFEYRGGRLQARIDGHPRRPERPVNGAAHHDGRQFSARYTGTLDEQSGALDLRADGDRRLPAIEGLYLSSGRRFVGSVTGHRWRGCSDVVILPAGDSDELVDRFAEPESTLGRMFERTALGSLAAQFSVLGGRDNHCDGAALAWVEHYFSLLPARPGGPADRKPLVEEMYRDAVFEALFDVPLKEFGKKDTQQLLATVNRLSSCDKLSAGARGNWREVSYLTVPLNNNAQHSRNMVAINLYAKDLYVKWLADTNVRLKNGPAGQPEAALDALPQLAVQIERANTRAAPHANAEVERSLETARRDLSAVVFERHLEQGLNRRYESADELLTLVALPARESKLYEPLSVQQKSRIQERINAKVVADAPALLESSIAGAEGVDGYRRLQNWRARYRDLVSRLAPETVNRLDAGAGARLDVIADRVAGRYRSRYETDVAGRGRGLEGLAAAVAFEDMLRGEAEPLLEHETFEQFAAERAADRKILYAANEDRLTRAAGSADTVGELNQLRRTYYHDGDPSTTALRSIRTAMDARERQLAPFGTGPGGGYLNALYGGDTRSLREMDAEFIRPYQRILGGEAITAMGGLMDAIAGMSGFKTSIAEGMRRDLATASLIVPVFAVYLIDYPFKFEQCLEEDAVVFEKTTTSETVYRDGWGNHLYSVPHPDVVEHFKVNRRFAHVFREVGLSDPDSVLGRFVDDFLGRGSDRLSVRQVVDGTRKMMNEYDDRCNGKVIRRLEQKMLDYFAEHRRRKDSARRAYLK